MREDCNSKVSILIRACARIATACADGARIATSLFLRFPLPISHFNSCMREDCNKAHDGLSLDLPILIHACARIATSGERKWLRSFDSCMREDCNIGLAAVYTARHNFNSCMREDCNNILEEGHP